MRILDRQELACCCVPIASSAREDIQLADDMFSIWLDDGKESEAQALMAHLYKMGLVWKEKR